MKWIEIYNILIIPKQMTLIFNVEMSLFLLMKDYIISIKKNHLNQKCNNQNQQLILNL